MYYLNCILGHVHDRQNAVHHLHGHVPGVTRQDNVVHHIPKLKE